MSWHKQNTALSTSAQIGLCQPLSTATSIPKQISEMAKTGTGTNVTEKNLFNIYIVLFIPCAPQIPAPDIGKNMDKTMIIIDDI